ncbi:protein TolA [Aquabacterium lacunae]|uniref:Protein TolA n=1 Tax=Aquabacterium lacunae TaxID=2528630 RepID=A0A4Q9H3S2_9BURK|nr:energy transducer TonB [Aquabacterium lacunae]TBO34201.1 protein TolA [Aquabacterium lacunae]
MSVAVASPPDILRPRVQEGWRQGLLMALAAHGLLAVGLMLHMSWKTQPQDVVEAEVWAEVPVAAQPAARVETAPVVPPPPAPEPAPAPVPPPPPPAPAPTPAPPPKPADIQVERKPEPEKKKPAKEVFEADPPQLKKKLEEARKKPEPVKEPAKEPPKPVAKETPKPVKEPAKEAAKEAVKAQAKSEPGPSSAQLERERQARLKSLMADLGGEGTPSAGPSAAYAGRIKARIKPNIVFTDEVAGNPLATVEVRCAPDGRIIGRRLITRSGNTAWDDAVLRAVDRTEVLPLDERGKVPPVMQIDFRPRDF